MLKKTYIAPAVESICIDATNVLCASPDPEPGHNNSLIPPASKEEETEEEGGSLAKELGNFKWDIFDE